MTLLAASLVATTVTGCGNGYHDPNTKRGLGRSMPIESCMAKHGSAPAPPLLDDVEPILQSHGLDLTDALAPHGDDYWLVIDFPDTRGAADGAKALAAVAAQGMFGPLEVRRSRKSVAMLPAQDGELESVYAGLPDVRRLRECTKSYALVPPT